MANIDFGFAIQQIPALIQGLPFTILITVVAMAVGLLFGTMLALLRLYRVPVFYQLSILFVSFFRGTPLIVQLFVFFYGMPMLIIYLNHTFQWQLNPDMLSPLLIVLVAYSLNSAAYLAEVVRSAIGSVEKGQLEAAHAVGMTTLQGYVRIILPQAFQIALPNLGNQLITLIKASALAFTIGVMEVMGISRIIANDGYRFLETYLLAALFYWLLSIALELMFANIEKRSRRYKGRTQGEAV
ncbi:amino acid ABC transporter permease [Bacillaceae bacterium SIJ1]|uniref:amino acid ABC transporter permease n=1 Tax=Litoribacterium kuwaitense TaxID=1398745 RepID=UPI0013EAF99B|nr:amino acid ABC transporter permease [Litoribacterium kuwaitense]NGP46232.1 amino acid ABC transporter permease [Litoribacterium kuwaitense]